MRRSFRWVDDGDVRACRANASAVPETRTNADAPIRAAGARGADDDVAAVVTGQAERHAE